MKKNLIAFIIISIFLAGSGRLPAQQVGIGQWRDLLPYNYGTSVDEMGELVFCSTPYSLFYYDREYNSVHRMSKVNNLSDLGVSKISYNEDLSTMVVAYSNTNLDLITKSLSVINIPDIKRKEILGNKTINSIMNYDKYAYLSCGFGIVVVNIERREIKDTYYIGPDGGSINVLDMTRSETTFFAATESGIYSADINNPNLAYFGNWTKMEDIPYPNGFFNRIHYFNGMLFANLYDPENPEDRLIVRENGEWRELETDNTARTYNLRTSADQLVISYSYFVKIYNADLTEDLKIYTYGTSGPLPSEAIIGKDGNYWIADRDKGLVKSWARGFEQEFIKPVGAPTADIFEMSVEDGKLWIVPGGLSSTWGNTWRSARLYSLINEEWGVIDQYNTPALDSLRDMVAVAVDPRNTDRVFAGSWNRGMIQVDNMTLSQVYHTHNSSLMPNVIEGYPAVKVGGIAFDQNNNMWVSNSGAENLISVRRENGTPEGEWESFNLGSNTIGLDVRKIIVDSYDQKWIIPRTTQSNPYYVYVFNENNPPGLKVRGLKAGVGQGNLPGTSVFSIVEDKDGEVWVGTDEGVAVFYSPGDVITEKSDAERILVDFGGYVQYLLETESVKAIVIDGANRKWIGTERAGVFLLSDDGTEQIHHFTAENSPLLSNSITSLAINDETGDVYIGTAKGLIGYKSTSTEPKPENTDVYAYPNPVKPGYSGAIAIKGLVQDAYVKITDVNGQLVYETRSEGGQAIWNGYNFDGRRANTGVYLVFITDGEGKEKLATKILFVN